MGASRIFQAQMKHEGAEYDERTNVFHDAWVPLTFDADTGEPVSHSSVRSARQQIEDYLASQEADLDSGCMEPTHALTESDLRIAELMEEA